MAERRSKHITDKAFLEKMYALKEEDVTSSFIYETFGDFTGKGPKYNVYDTIDIPPNTYHKNKNTFTTTVGIWVFNIYFIDKDLFSLFGYINETINKKIYGKINKKMSYALMEDDITIEQLKRYQMKTQKFMPYISILSPNHTEKLFTATEVINKKKEELKKKYAKEIEAGDVVAVEQMEKELLDFALDYMGDDPAMDTFISGARSDINNNFKNMFVMKGAVRNPDPNAEREYDIAFSNYMDGVKREEYYLYANSLSAGPYSRSRKTAVGGWWEKLFMSAYQSIVLDEPGSDCGTKRYITVHLTSNNIEDYMYSYIIEGSKLVELTSKNQSKYEGKTVKMRFASMCESKKCFCNACVGNRDYRIGIRNVGAAFPKIPSTVKNIAMKAFHDSTVATVEMDLGKVFGVK